MAVKGYIQVADDNWNFINSDTGEYFVPHGAAYFDCLKQKWPPMILREDTFNPEKMDRELGLMAEVGCNYAKSFIEAGYLWPTLTAMDAKAEDEMDQWLDIAGKHGIRLMLIVDYVRPDKCDTWSPQGRQRMMYYEQDFYRRFGNRPEIFAEALIGESTVPFDNPYVNAGFGSYCEERYGSAEAAETSWNGEVKNVNFNDLPMPLDKVNPGSNYLFDYKLYHEEFGTQIIRERSNAVKHAAAVHGRNMMVCCDINPWIFPNVPMHQMSSGQNPYFHNHFVDFQTTHLYPPPMCQPGGFGDPLDSKDNMDYCMNIFQALGRLAWRDKPVMLGEWGWYGGCDSQWGETHLKYRTEEEHADYCERFMRESMDYINGWMNWAWSDFPGAGDITVGGGLYTADHKLKEWGKRYKKINEELDANKPMKRKPGEVIIDMPLKEVWTDPKAEDAFWDTVRDALSTHDAIDFRTVIDDCTVQYDEEYLGGPRSETEIPGGLGQLPESE